MFEDLSFIRHQQQQQGNHKAEKTTQAGRSESEAKARKGSKEGTGKRQGRENHLVFALVAL